MVQVFFFDIFSKKTRTLMPLREISILEFLKNEFLTHTVSFGIGSAFPKCPGSTVSEDTGQSPGPLYKVCHIKKETFVLFDLFSYFTDISKQIKNSVKT